MKKVLVLLTGLLMLAAVVNAGTFNASEKSGDLTVNVSIDNNPVKVGENGMTVEIIDKDGISVTDARVSIYYFMPSMPAMNYEARAMQEGDKYTAVLKPTMPGEWTADIRINKAGEDRKVTVSFPAR